MSKEVIKKENKIEYFSTEQIKTGKARGSEDVSGDDIVIPRVELLQALSPEITPGTPEYIEGAKPGQLYNTVTKEIYGDHIVFCPSIYKKEFLAFKKRDVDGGGFVGIFNSEKDAQEAIFERAERDGASSNQFEINEAGQHYGLVINENGSVQEACVSMSRTKLKASKEFNTLVRMAGGDRFSRIYTIHSAQESNSKGRYFNYKVKYYVDEKGAPICSSKALFEKAEKIYNLVSEGIPKVNKIQSEESTEETEM
jgi:hypothetical protein